MKSKKTKTPVKPIDARHTMDRIAKSGTLTQTPLVPNHQHWQVIYHLEVWER